MIVDKRVGGLETVLPQRRYYAKRSLSRASFEGSDMLSSLS